MSWVRGWGATGACRPRAVGQRDRPGGLDGSRVDQNRIEGPALDGLRLDLVRGATVTRNRGSASERDRASYTLWEDR